MEREQVLETFWTMERDFTIKELSERKSLRDIFESRSCSLTKNTRKSTTTNLLLMMLVVSWLEEEEKGLRMLWSIMESRPRKRWKFWDQSLWTKNRMSASLDLKLAREVMLWCRKGSMDLLEWGEWISLMDFMKMLGGGRKGKRKYIQLALRLSALSNQTLRWPKMLIQELSQGLLQGMDSMKIHTAFLKN